MDEAKKAHLQLIEKFKWMMDDEDGRWEEFRQLRDRLRPLVQIIPAQDRVEIALNALRGGGEIHPYNSFNESARPKAFCRAAK